MRIALWIRVLLWIILKERVKATSNQLLKYRYQYFIYLLTNDNRYAKQSIDALMAVIGTLLPKNKEEYPHQAENSIVNFDVAD